MTIEDEAMVALRAMDDLRQIEMLGFLQDVAREFPRPPRLRLVRSIRAVVPLLTVNEDPG
jgi:hypothetical protein